MSILFCYATKWINKHEEFASYIPNQSNDNFKNKKPIALLDDTFQNMISYLLEKSNNKNGIAWHLHLKPSNCLE